MAQHGTPQTQHCKIHTNLISLLADLFDCKKAMLEAGQPGELPLMRELSSLRRVRSLRDPSMESNLMGGASSTTRTPRWKSPIAKTRETRYDQFNVSRSRDIKGDQSSASNTRASLGMSHSVASPFSVPIHAMEAERAWDLGMEPEEASAGMHVKRKPGIKTHRIEVFKQRTPTMNLHSDQFSLHNWRDPSWASDMEASHATSYSMQSEKGMPRHNKSGDLTARGRSGAHSRNGYEMQMQQMLHDRMHGSRRMHERYQQATLSGGSKQHPQEFSPLVLNSLDEVHYHGNSFSLEGNYHERHNQPSRGARRRFSSNDILSPPYSKRTARKGQREATKTTWKAQHMIASSTSTSQRTVSQSSLSGAWEVASNQLEDELDVSELPKNGCGIPCYWSKSQRRGKTLLDIAERSFACGLYSKSPKTMVHSGSRNYGSQDEPCAYPGHEPVPPLDLEALPLLSDPSACSEDIIGTSADDSDYLNGELGLHGGDASRARSDAQDTSGSEGKELAIYRERPRSLSQKYRPKVFEELVGQNLVAQALSNAVHKRKIAPVYLFQGSRGTGKTSAARIFAAALNCVTVEEQRPCGVCKECVAFTTGKSLDIREVDAASNNAVEKVKALLQTAFSAPSFSQFKVFIIDECHMLTNETWNALLKLLEEPPRNVVFILITTDPDKLPPMAVSRCQKFPFPKIKDADIVGRLQALAKREKLYVQPGALDLVAARADGSLRDAEIILDQLSLLGQKITVSTVHELFGSVSDEKLLGLLDFALSSDTVNTVQRARELIDSGVEPLDLMVQLATLITDILAGSNDWIAKSQGGFSSNHALSEERLRFALQVLSDAEKQLRASSNDRTTWLTAALLQLGPARTGPVALSTSGTSGAASPVVKTSSNGTRQVLKIINGKSNHKSAVKGSTQKKSHPLTTMNSNNRSSRSSFEVQVHPEDATNKSSAASRDPSHAKTGGDSMTSNRKKATLVGPGNLEGIWCNVLERCKSSSIRQLLQSHGKLLAVSISADGANVFLEFDTVDSKSRSDRCKRNIANSFQELLGLTVDVRIMLASNAKVATSMGARVQAIVDQQALDLQCHSERSSDAMLQQREQKCIEVGSLHYWRSQSKGTSPAQTLSRANSTKSFPAILTISRNNKVGDSDHMMRSLNSTPHFGNGVKPFKNAELSTFEGTRLRGSRNTKAKIVSSLQRSQSRNSTQEIVLDNSTDNLGAEHVFHSADAAIAVPKNGFSYTLEEENLRLESQSKYGGLLCWRNPKVEDDKEVSKHHQKRCTILKRLVPCANS